MNLKAKAKQLPETPGVYIMKDGGENIIYIGKAKNLKNRVSQYFQNLSKHPPKIQRLVEGIRDFDYIHADTELEALLLECRLIKDIKPMYNSQLKNHRKYVYININLDNKFPTLEVTAEKEGEGIYFGPYTSSNSVERAINALKEQLKIRYCGTMFSRSTGCLNSQLGYCMAPCAGEINEKDYRKLIDEALVFLNGGKSGLLKQIEQKMLAAAERLDFDKAAKYRDDLKALGHLVNKQRTIQFTGRSKPTICLEKISQSEYKLFIIKGSRVMYKERFPALQDKEILQQHIADLIAAYREELLMNNSVEIEKDEIDQAQIVYSYIRNKKDCCYLTVAKSWIDSKERDKLFQGIKKLIELL